ncbi:kinase-like domain-containing protein [Zychaea mexicana]|uniref:kinase-like domain-containing protein n=1 Tax=Zychaea mexicana TaxID=64656 RepID=UPI0022FE637B|nr:kinase-like domain-containing protein [Zychaea mexicana]KAI9484717.1 kinase-like domain-containing protein [Zychaea mexicana]
MSADKSDSDCADDSSDCSNKFWHRPPEQSPEATVNNDSSESLGTKAFGGVLTGKAKNGMDDDRGISKRRQTKMLLVSLIESFCRVHGDTPEANRRVFFLICQTLSSLGFIDSEFVDEMASVRSTFQSAFQTLFYTAVETVNDPGFRKPMMIASTEFHQQQQQQQQQQRVQNQQPPSSSSTPQPEQPPIFDLNIQNSRYRNDFVQVSLLGRGGFASVWRAHNKLDNIDYAVKQIHLGPDLSDDARCDDGQGPYDKIFREIKHLARLEHKNVVRYYSSWLEYTNHIPENGGKSSTQGEVYNDGNSSDMDSVFGGRDPTFDDDDNSGEPSFSPVKLSEEDMSRIDFVDDGASKDVVAGESINAATDYVTSEINSSSKKDAAVCIPNFEAKRSTRKEYERRVRKRARTRSGSRCGWTLYIQMYLCPATLYDYIKHRNDTGTSVDKERNIELFTQILEGAAYIHASGLIHRDLKPSNIFLTMTTTNEYHNSNGRRHWRSSSSSLNNTRMHHQHSFSYDSVRGEDGTLRDCMWNEVWIPKLGDFGLAAAVMTTHCKQAPPSLLSASSPTTITDHLSFMDCHTGSQHSLMTLSSSYCRRGSNSSSSEEEEDSRFVMQKLTSAVGTRTYAAPEQLADPPRPYDDKADIYSLGIIFFELFQPFTTVMERACAIQRLKKGVFPDGFVEKYPKESALILWMMDEEPAHRPSAEQLLEFELFVPQLAVVEENMYSTIQAQLQAKSVALDTKDQEMAALRKRLEQIEQQNKRDMDAMQRRVDELERQLSAQLGVAECTPSPTTTSSSDSSNGESIRTKVLLGRDDSQCK